VAGRQVDPPDDADQRVGQQDDAGCEQATPGQAVGRFAELKDRLGTARRRKDSCAGPSEVLRRKISGWVSTSPGAS